MASPIASQEELHGEDAIIALLAPLASGAPGAFGLKDDCALLTPEPGTDFVLKTDPVAEGVHFLAGDAPEDIAWKALAVNVSDLAAKGATPVGYLMALSFPEAPSRGWLSAFAAGLKEAQGQFGCHLLGGDTDRRPGPLTVSITVVGSVPQGRMVRRGTAKPSDVLFISGSIGDAALGLALLRDPALASAWGLAAPEVRSLIRRFHRPEPRLALGPALRQCASAAMDVSDGLVKDLDRLLRASCVAGHLAAADVPLSVAARKFVGHATDQADRRLARLITAGDDYEVLAAVPAAHAADFRVAAAAAAIPVVAIGRLIAGSGLHIDGPDGRLLRLDRPGWDHF
ncbi:MAG TPA: thiamine-phosphate kinase [Hyphomicrobiaceae bacterium]|nr:thiamine-phosphate kinase [Hyphomicrobiaceae bacterium]